MEMFDEQPSADLTEFAVAVMHPVQQLDAGQPAFETVEQCFDVIAMREQIAAKVIRLFDVIPFLYRFKFSRADKINGYPVREATTFCPITFNCSQIFSCKSAKVLKFTQLHSFFRCCQTRSMGLISGL